MTYRSTDFLYMAIIALFYALIAKVVITFFSANGVVSILWPSSGLAIAALLIGGKKYWPGIFIGALSGNIMAGSPAGLSVFIALGNTLEALAGIWFLVRIGHFKATLTHHSDYLQLGWAGIVSACVGALIGVSALVLSGHIKQADYVQNLLQWWQGDLLGIILVTPLLLVWRQLPHDWLRRERIVETIACFGLFLFMVQVICFGLFDAYLGHLVRSYWIFLFVVWAAVRFGRHGVLLVISITTVFFVLGAIHRTGVFAGDFGNGGLINVWFYTLALSVTGITLALIIGERKQAGERILRLIKLYKALSETNQAIVRMQQQTELFPLVCRCAVEFGGMSMAWVGQLDEGSDLILPVASYGSHLDFLDGIVVSSNADVMEGRGSSGKALRENHPVVINNYFTDPLTLPWRQKAIDCGWNAAATFPIQRGGKPFAILAVYHTQIDAFDTEAIVLLEEMSKDIAFALDNFDREVQRKEGEESTRLAASVYETSSEAIMVADAENRIIATNPAFTVITGYLKEDVIGLSPNIFKSGKHDQAFYEAMWGEINNTGKWQGEIWDRRKSGEIYPKWLNISTVFNTDGTVLHRIALFSDMSHKKESEELIWKQANFDSLTGLPNRNMFHDRLDQEIKKSRRANTPFALIFLDLDNFKEVNDSLGHAMGDVLLKEAAQRILSCARDSDTVARFGGDEFTLILSELDELESVNRITQQILHKLTEPFQLRDEVVYISASIGITVYPSDATEIEVLVKNADQAMYAAKNAGRNSCCYFTPAMQELAQSRMRIANDLHNALARNQFWVAYQPIVDLKTGKIRKAEALLRWQHPEHGLISPAEFIPVAEHTGLINEIGDWVFHQASLQVKHWQEIYGDEFQISVNKSPVQINDKSNKYPPWPLQLQRLGLSGRSIVVEITEGLLLDANAYINEKLLEFRDAGIQVSLDDFGTGYSSLSYLKKFDIDYLKIDQSFVRGLALNSNDMALCEAIIVMAHSLGMMVIAEGVETEEQRDLLLGVGCDFGQGYWFSKAISANEFEKLM